jgi:hypothetical protein
MKTDVKKFILAVLITGFLMWVVAGIWHNLIMPSLYEEVHATHEGIEIMLVAYFILAGFMAYLYPRLYDGKKPVRDGLKFGIIIGLLWVFPHELAMVGAHSESILYVIRNAIWHMVEQGIGGIVLALVFWKLGYKK